MLFKVYTKPIDEMLSYCKVIHGLQNIFKLLTNDSNQDTLMGTSILNDGGNFRTTALSDTTCVIVYGPICLSVNFLKGQLIFKFLVLSHT